jgi:predicted nuclease of restriction endonuclease-like (RecB) superfamily
VDVPQLLEVGADDLLESGKRKRDAVRLVSAEEPIRLTACDEVSWSHYRLLMQVEDPAAREWYMNEAAEQHWSTRQLERQISVLYYERLLVSRRKAPVRGEAATKLATVEPEQFIRDPYILEFLDLKDYPALRESAVEQVIIDNLQAFLLEPCWKGARYLSRKMPGTYPGCTANPARSRPPSPSGEGDRG